MKLPHLHRSDSTETDAALEAAGYDAQSDLALPTSEAGSEPTDGFIPFAGELAPEPPAVGYDAERDTGIDPGWSVVSGCEKLPLTHQERRD